MVRFFCNVSRDSPQEVQRVSRLMRAFAQQVMVTISLIHEESVNSFDDFMCFAKNARH